MAKNGKYFNGRTFLHHILGEDLIKELKICRIRQNKYEEDGNILNRDLMFYSEDCGIYKTLPIKRLNAEIRSRINNISDNRQREVRRYIEDMAEIKDIKFENYIATKNVILDVFNRGTFRHSPDIICTRYIPTEYNRLQSECAILDEFMNSITCGNKDIENLLYEFIGYCLSPTIFIHNFFIIIGEGSNGKSTFFKLLTKLLGYWNVGNTPLNKYGGRFELAGMEYIAVNIGDDISSKALLETDNLKKLVSGDPVKVEQKGKQGYVIYPTCKHIFSANTMPKLVDTSGGIKRRFVAIPFNADFKKNGDPYILDKIIEAGGLTVLMNRALEGLQRLRTTHQFTMCDEVLLITEKHLKEMNPVALFNEMWLNNEFEPYESPTAKEFVCVAIDEVVANQYYKYYKDFCKQYGFEALGITRFNQEMERLGYIKTRCWNGTLRGKYVYALKLKECTN
ncbi:phage/plasmid primase, P4 family [Veillonella sp. R32]|uniref:DNA primase family protein n=1 Tax=Veillonella sp. R32 TaxID=2021312 RepID=UPI00138A52FF|nr:phage/plasmid primase, P4 family [Veillonella sp. R32]KAF1679109.1 hypothetical protein VER_09670 [Veillonella sp. R32]